jgi:hypothetical protein
MFEPPKPSEIQNVFALNKPQHMLSKLLWEIDRLSTSLSVWTKRTEFPEPLFIVWNAAVTAWHITDWLWQSGPDIRAILARRYNLKFVEGSKTAVREGLESFQEAIANDCRFLYVCREIANGSKHMRKNKVDPDVTALARWLPVIQGAGHVKPGDYTLSLIIIDGDQQQDATRWFIQAFGYWEQLFTQEKLVSIASRSPDKFIKSED